MATRETRTSNQKSAMIAIVENLLCGIGIGGCATRKIQVENLVSPLRELEIQTGTRAQQRKLNRKLKKTGRRKQKSRCTGQTQLIRDGKIDSQVENDWRCGARGSGPPASEGQCMTCTCQCSVRADALGCSLFI